MIYRPLLHVLQKLTYERRNVITDNKFEQNHINGSAEILLTSRILFNKYAKIVRGLQRNIEKRLRSTP